METSAARAIPTSPLRGHERVRLEREGRIAWLTLTRDSRLNAIDTALIEQLTRVALALFEDRDSRVVVVTGEGRAFSSGIDLKDLAAHRIEMDYFVAWEKLLRLFEEMDKIVLVGMHGHCLGGGLQLALACDIRVSTPDCQIGLPAIKESLVPGLSPWRLPKYVGWGRAKKLVFGGENVDGEEAARIGLVDHLVPSERFHDGLDRLARHYLTTCSTALRHSKKLVNRAFAADYDGALAEYLRLQELSYSSFDAEEAKAAYREGRSPRWQ